MHIRSLVLIIAFVALTLTCTFVWGQDVGLVVNELKVFSVYKLERVAISDPEVADITILSEQEIMLMAKEVGSTSLIIWDESGQRTFNIIVIDTDLEKVAQRVRGVLAAADIHKVRVKVEGDKIYAIAEVLTEYELSGVRDVLAPFTNVVNLVRVKERQPLIEIDVNVLEISLDDLKRLGLNWINSLPVQYTEPSGAQPMEAERAAKAQTTGKFPKLWRVFKWDRTTIDARLNFLVEEDKARTLANPKLVTLSGKEASFLVGGEVPYVVVEDEGRTSVQWKNYGVDLKINALVNSKNEINTTLKAEVTDLDWANAVTQEGYSIPALSKRAAQTELFLNEGDTIFIAGLIKNEDSRNIDRLPWLSKVPILGELFKSKEFRNERTELVISVSPRIVGEKAAPEYVAEEMVRQEALLEIQRRFPEYGDDEDSPLTYYTHMVGDIIAQSVLYPAEAQETKPEGIVKVALHLSSDGKLQSVSIKESSGYSTLDEAALGAVQVSAPYPSFPSQISEQELELVVPVVFKREDM